ncbi:MAG: protein translocase subunit SecF [Nanoarchaeota archaeon]|nr:protein translocase subunit SecF [Nanoarchaeota archaeon]
MNLIKHKNIFLGASGVLVIISWTLVLIFGFKEGIDLKGGTEWHVRMGNERTEEEVRNVVQVISREKNFVVKKTGDGTFIFRLGAITEMEHAEYLKGLKKKFGEDVEEISFTSVGPSIGRELRSQAIWAGVLVILGISLYVAWAFRKLKEPIASWKYGLATLVTLFHDVSVPMGLLALLGNIKNIEIDTNFIVALLVVMGFSVHDTIVVFDRIRENLQNAEGKKHGLEATINKSVSETLVRSINTSLTLVLVLVALLLWGPATLFYFILTILIGTVIGTYSSICVASPLVYIWSKKSTKN